CWSRTSFRFIRSIPDNGGCGKHWESRTRTRGRATCAESWRSTAEKSTFFFRVRAAAEKFLLRRSIAAVVMIPGRLAKGWLRFSVREGISLAAYWRARAQARQ